MLGRGKQRDGLTGKVQPEITLMQFKAESSEILSPLKFREQQKITMIKTVEGIRN